MSTVRCACKERRAVEQTAAALFDLVPADCDGQGDAQNHESAQHHHHAHEHPAHPAAALWQPRRLVPVVVVERLLGVQGQLQVRGHAGPQAHQFQTGHDTPAPAPVLAHLTSGQCGVGARHARARHARGALAEGAKRPHARQIPTAARGDKRKHGQ